jgi:5-methylcytosine-specific restriction endonuclease McrA
MERLFTEAEWRAIADIERFSGTELREVSAPWTKRVFGAAFECGEFYLAADSYWRGPDYIGPPDFYFFVFERQSGLRFCGEAESRGRALELARGRVELIGRDYLDKMMSQWRAELDELRARKSAEQQARIAAEQAKKERKLKKLSKRARAVFESSGGKCHYCSTQLDLAGKWHIEHKFPRALFGGSEQSNLVAACAPCNHRKRDKTDLEFQALIAANSESLAEAA